MNILVINQPTENRGDEAAHRSLMRKLNDKFRDAKITVLFYYISQDSVNQLKVRNVNNRYVNIQGFIKGSHFIQKLGLKFRLLRLSILHPAHKKVYKQIKNADIVICAPGGICMGLFQSWGHLYWLMLAKLAGKKTIYYSRSFGPFPVKSFANKIFKKISLQLLNYFEFISIRDSKTMALADDMRINYIPSIDTAFLDTPKFSNLPKIIDEKINSQEYIVFVPNSLTWHPAFKMLDKNYLFDLYIAIMSKLLDIYPENKILMLPQLFNDKIKSDYNYFLTLQTKINDDRVYVIDESYSSDIQQNIISQAKFLVGARYHSVVFAINNNIPFVALSYEHKMSGLLKILKLTDQMIDIEELGSKSASIPSVVDELVIKLKNEQNIDSAKDKSREIAENCFNELLKVM